MNRYITAAPGVFFIISMVPFFMLTTSIFGFTPEFYFSDTFALIVFEGFKLAGAFAALAFITLVIQSILED